MYMSASLFRKLALKIPLATSLKTYRWDLFHSDVFAGIITAILLIPQGMAYALLAGLPVQVGIYTSLLPAIAYVLFGTSRVLSVGPVSIAAIMVASTLSSPEIMEYGTPIQNAMILALEGGLILCLMSLLNMGNLVHYISRPVLTGFTSGAAVIILISQIPHMIGLHVQPCNTIENCVTQIPTNINIHEMGLGLLAFSLLIIMGTPLSKLLTYFNLKKSLRTALTKSAPLLSVISGTLLVTLYSLQNTQGVDIVGFIPKGMPEVSFSFLEISTEHALVLLPSALFISLIAYVESVAIAKVMASARGEKISPNQELVALGTANLASSISGGMPVAGGFSRTMVNYSAGAQTQIAMLIAVILIAVVLHSLTQTLEYIPTAALAAVIIVAVTPLVKLKSIFQIWHQDKADGFSQAITFIGVLVLGIEEGIMLGVVVTVFNYLKRAGKPHLAVVGRIKNTNHYRNINRHNVQTWKHLLLIRIDENITFANINYIAEFIEKEQKNYDANTIVLIFSSVSYVDTTAVSTFKEMVAGLRLTGTIIHLSEVRGPVFDKLKKMDFFNDLLPGRVFFQTNEAVTNVTKTLD